MSSKQVMFDEIKIVCEHSGLSGEERNIDNMQRGGESRESREKGKIG